MWCLGITCGAVCVYPNRVTDCVATLKAAGGSHVPIASGTVLSVLYFYLWVPARLCSAEAISIWPNAHTQCNQRS